MSFEFPVVYAVKHKNENIRMDSRSGGIFTALSDYVLENEGVIYGCILNENLDVIHVRATTKEQRNMMRGSKYVQSKIGSSYIKAKEDLEKGIRVLFSGTPCQIVGLKKYLGKEYKNLILIDVVCHGVPSPKVYKDYISWWEKKKKAKCVSLDFRNKRTFGWEAHIETLKFVKNKNIDSKIYASLFYSHNTIRPSCYKCPYKSTIRKSDITIADYWGIEKASPGFNDNKGVSLVIINNDKGLDLLNNIKEEINYNTCLLKDSLQPPIVENYEMPDSREQFWQDYSSYDFKYIAKKYAKNTLIDRIKRKMLFYILIRKNTKNI